MKAKSSKRQSNKPNAQAEFQVEGGNQNSKPLASSANLRGIHIYANFAEHRHVTILHMENGFTYYFTYSTLLLLYYIPYSAYHFAYSAYGDGVCLYFAYCHIFIFLAYCFAYS
jgi:hypothetical protein